MGLQPNTFAALACSLSIMDVVDVWKRRTTYDVSASKTSGRENLVQAIGWDSSWLLGLGGCWTAATKSREHFEKIFTDEQRRKQWNAYYNYNDTNETPNEC